MFKNTRCRKSTYILDYSSLCRRLQYMGKFSNDFQCKKIQFSRISYKFLTFFLVPIEKNKSGAVRFENMPLISKIYVQNFCKSRGFQNGKPITFLHSNTPCHLTPIPNNPSLCKIQASRVLFSLFFGFSSFTFCVCSKLIFLKFWCIIQKLFKSFFHVIFTTLKLYYLKSSTTWCLDTPDLDTFILWKQFRSTICEFKRFFENTIEFYLSYVWHLAFILGSRLHTRCFRTALDME